LRSINGWMTWPKTAVGSGLPVEQHRAAAFAPRQRTDQRGGIRAADAPRFVFAAIATYFRLALTAAAAQVD